MQSIRMSTSSSKPWANKLTVAGLAATAVLLIGLVSIFVTRSATTRAPTMTAEEVVANTPTVTLNNGVKMPLFGLGTSGLQKEQCTESVQQAIKLGYRHIDSAIIYPHNTPWLGKALKAVLDAGEIKREDLFIVTKLPQDQHEEESVVPALKEALAKLHLDYVDLFLVHWPCTDKPGPTLNPPMEATWKGMEAAADQNLTRAIGVSNFSPEKITEWFKDARIYPAVNQVEVHPNWRNQRLLDFCKEKGIHVTAYGPLTSPGNMAGKWPILLKDETVIKIAKEVGKTPAQVLLRWGLQHGTSVIPEGKSQEHQEDNLGCLGWELSSEHYETLSSFKFQAKYFTGQGMGYSEKGPWHTFEELWNEPKPAADP